MEKYIEDLKGISYYDWIRLREGIDRNLAEKSMSLRKALNSPILKM